MAIKVLLYGELKNKVERTDKRTESIGIIEMDKGEMEDISDVLDRLGIKIDRVSHIFLNHEYSHLERELEEGDRLALFPKDMALLYKWYFSKKR